MKKSVLKITGIIFVTILFCTIFFVRLSMLKKSVYPNGLDGYFYALQAKSFSQTGHLENPDLECGYYLCGICSWIFGDSILGVKIWSALSSALLSLSVFVLLKILCKKSPNCFLISAVGMLLCSVTVSTSTMGINYINNQTGLLFLIFYAAILISIFSEKLNKKNIWKIFVASIFFVLSIVSHKVSGIYAIVFSVIFIFFRFIKERKFEKKYLWIIPVLFFAVIFVAAIFIKQIPRFKNTFDFPSLAFMHKNILSSFGEKGFLGGMEISLMMIFAWIFSVWLFIKNKKISVENIFVFVLFFPFWNLDSDMGFRMSVNGTIVGTPLLIFMIYKIFHNEKNENKFFIQKKIFLCGLNAILFVLLFFTPQVYNPKNDPPFAYYKTVVEKIELPDDSLLIAHLGLNHVYTYEKNLRDCLNWLPNFSVDENKVWRLAYGANVNRIKSLFPDKDFSDDKNLIQQIDGQYILLKENLWQEYLKREEKEISETFNNWFNPHEKRPDYIRKGKNKN